MQNGSGKRKLDEDRKAEREASYRSLYLKKEAVVVLTRYPEHKLGTLRSSSPVQYSSDYSVSDSDSLMSHSSSKRRKMEQKPGKSTKDHEKRSQTLQTNIKIKTKTGATTTTTCAPQASASTKTGANNTSSLQETKAKTGATTTCARQASASTQTGADKTSLPQSSTNTIAKTGTNKASSLQESIKTQAKSGATTTSAPQAGTSTKIGANKASSLQESIKTQAKSGATTTSAPQAGTSTKIGANKASSLHESIKTQAKSSATTTTCAQQAGTSTKIGTNKASSLHESIKTQAKSGETTTCAPQTSASTKTGANKTSMPQSSANTSAKTDANKALSLQASANSEGSAQTVTAQRQAPEEHPKSAPVLYRIKQKISVGMTVLARRKALNWQRGKVLVIITDEDGNVKYQINFDDKKKLVSAHHIASDTIPVVEQTFVGARVVVRKRDNESQFFPGVLADVPSRANRMRFLVFMDDHTPIYVGLPLLRLLYKPPENVVDDIPAGIHKTFMKSYLKDWPFPQVIHFRVGQTISVERNGAYRKCEVQQVDCLLVKICFQGEDEHKEWLHRGSFRLEANMSKFAELEAKENATKDTSQTTGARSKSRSNHKDPPLSEHSAPQSQAETNTRRRGRKARSPGQRPPPAGSQHAEKPGP
ncbi:histone-lysine N-methyltransferase SETDB1-A-like isoform X2 [Thalassophryne amazonica]|uniref:histone-lysine N-methyltransferase SETDB1-A-like isoform X2 n=1 Tax=Thalassophryne amazonica TaxID=390379 RepID=UPI0014723684|nr:histone-lysine N-methyltransferase SETDB1-A-like isoform X2 [Thalassophryne amazonica]